MSSDIVLYCKSYRNDLHRVDALVNSILEYNHDKIPTYISCPTSDMSLFKSKNWDSSITLIADEEIDASGDGWIGQQIIKAQFWKLNVCHNYLCLDSDSVFIKPFYKKDFLYEGNIPYTVLHEDKELMEWAQKANLGFDIQQSSESDRDKVMRLFNRKGVYYDFGPSPVIWSSAVWKSLFESYIILNGLQFKNLIEYCGSEFTWYGEWLLTSNIIPIYPRQPLFKVFHYPGQYFESKNKGYTLEDFKKLYLGVILQSNWNAPLTY